MKIIALANQKGGVGKSISTTNIAVALALWGKKVLIVDLDPQGNASSNVGLDGDEEKILGKTVYEALMGLIPCPHAIYQVMPSLDILPANLDLAAAELELVQLTRREYRLQKLFKQIESLGYDYVLIDCPPSLGILTLNALTAAHAVLVPVKPGVHAVKGFVRLAKTLAAVRADELNPDLRFGGIFLTMFNGRRSIDQRIQQDLSALGEQYPLLATPIRETTVLAQAEEAGKSIFAFARNSNAAEDYLALAQEIMTKEEQHG